MNDPLQALLQGPARPSIFPANSRYQGIDTAMLAASDGRTIVFLRRRFVPAPERFVTFQEHTIQQGDRLDNLAAQYLGDPELFWRMCDANGAIRPEELTDVLGRVLAITLPEGIPQAKP